MSTAPLPFLGRARHALVDDLLRAFDEVAASGTPQWWSLEAPPGWGKTRVVQELFARLAADRQAAGTYWPATLAPLDAEQAGSDPEGLRKRVAPEASRADPRAAAPYFWWGISCLQRPGSTFEALVNDLDQFRRHEAGLERRWTELATRRERLAKHVRARGREVAEVGVGDVVDTAVEAASLTVPGLGLLLLVGKWTARRGYRELRDRREPPGATPTTAGESVIDELAPAMERLGSAGVPLVVVVEDAHAADAALVELLARLMAAEDSRMLLVTTSWTGLLTEAERPVSELLDRSPDARVRRIRGEAEVADLSLDERATLARSALPQLDDERAGLLAARYANPWALLTACRLGVVRRGAARGTLVASAIAELPGDVAGLFGQLWKELPGRVREALALSVLAAPTSVGRRLSLGEDRWDPELVQAAVRTEDWLREHGGELAADLDLARDGYVWVRSVDEWLQRFHDPAQRQVALSAALAEYGEQERQAFYDALVQQAGTEDDVPLVRRRCADRLVLALAAEGLAPCCHDRVVAAADRACRELAASPLVNDQFLVISISRLVLRGAEDPADPRLWKLRRLLGAALSDIGRHREALAVRRLLLDDRLAAQPADVHGLLDARTEIALSLAASGQAHAAAEQLRVLLSARFQAEGIIAPATLWTANLYASVLGQSGRYDEAVRVLGMLLDQYTRLPDADPDDVRLTRVNLAGSLQKTGQLRAATAEFRTLLDELDRTAGPDAEQTFAVRTQLAMCVQESGRADAALIDFRRLIEDLIRVVGPDAPNTLLVRTAIADCLRLTGRRQEAIQEYRLLLDDHRRVQGPEAPATLVTRNNLAACLAEAGEVDAAVAELREVLEERVRVHGPDAPDTLLARNNLASLIAAAGDVDAALREFEALVEDQIRVQGADAPQTLSVRHNLASWLAESGQHGAAIPQLRGLVADQVRLLGHDAPATLTTRTALARSLGQAGHVEAAVEAYGALADARRRVLGPDAPDTLFTRNELAVWLARSGQMDAAVDEYRALVEDMARVHGPDARETLVTRKSLASCLAQTGAVRAAIESFSTLLDDMLRVLGPDDAQTASTREHLSAWRSRIDVAPRRRPPGRDAPAARDGRWAIATRLWDAGRESDAISELRGLLDDEVQAHGSDSAAAVRSRNQLASWLGRSGEVDAAVEELERLLADVVRVQGPDAPDVLTVRGNLAAWRGRAGSPDLALEEFRRILDDRTRVLGAEASDTLHTRKNIAFLLAETGRTDAAIAELRALLADNVRLHGAEAPATRAVGEQLQALLDQRRADGPR